QFNQIDRVLNSKTIWLCASCKTCTTRCPNDIDITEIMDFLKSLALAKGVPPKVPGVAQFIKIATRNMKWFGRLFEAELAGEMNLRTGQPFKDMDIAAKLIKTGKLRFFPEVGFRFETQAKSERKTEMAQNVVAYYPGCSVKGTSREFDLSTRAVADLVGLVLEEPKGWTCCGTAAASWQSASLGTKLSLDNLKLIKKSGHTAVTTPCAACFWHLKHAAAEAKDGQHSDLEDPGVEVEHLINTMLDRIGLDKIKEKVTKPLKDLKAVCYYGCLLSRPPKLTGAANPEYPMNMDHIVRALGAQTLDWSYKTECCGASQAFTVTDLCLTLVERILQNAKDVGAEMVVVACPLCQANLETRQEGIAKRGGPNFDLPVLFFTQLMGLAMGLSSKEVGLPLMLHDPRPLLTAKGLLS
ncbi:MAG: heterodisulfide reductase-related iron-sulfur binding cluster, partial [Dehalococcoidia bacterium]|nr:heterodisulfide reductase-related iron-sulfur binding cluster [Dehalococcoidia bacterium]